MNNSTIATTTATIEKLKAAIVETDLEIATLTTELGRHMLDGERTKARALEDRLAALSARLRSQKIALAEAESRQAAEEELSEQARKAAEEERRHRRVKHALMEYYSMLGQALDAKSNIIEARRNLGATERRERRRMDFDRLETLSFELRDAGIPYQNDSGVLELESDPARLREESARFRKLAEEAAP